MDRKLDFEGLGRDLVGRARELLPDWLPGGRMVGREYTCGSIHGEEGDSLKVNVNTGKWADFSSTEKGGDLISLYAAIKNIGQGDAAKDLADWVGYKLGERPVGQLKSRPARAPRPATPTEPVQQISPPPGGEPAPDMKHHQWGEPTSSWCYTSGAGNPLFYVARYDPRGERKQFIPWCWSATTSRWIQKGYPEPRPLYGLDLLAARPDAPVLIVEGEKACDAARKIAGNIYVVVSWPNGSKAVDKADWSAVYGRRILIWPDADAAGVQAADRIATVLLTHCPEVKIISITPPDVFTAVDGFDAANALELGWKFKDLADWAKPRAAIYTPPVVLPPAQETPLDHVPMGDDEDLTDMPASAYAIWDRAGLSLMKSGTPIPNVDNVLKLLRSQPCFSDLVWIDEFHRKMFTRWNTIVTRQWAAVDDINLTVYLQHHCGFSKIYTSLVRDAVVAYAHSHTRNEPKDWMETLVWDGKPRIDGFFTTHFGADDNPYTYAASGNWWKSIAARVYKPGCKVDTMVILEGNQGTFKSTALSIIGGPWFAEGGRDILSKDFLQCLKGKLIIEIGELSSFSKAETNAIKQVISCKTDTYRASYGQYPEDYPRQCVFVGTTNETEYLKDATGGRRFWPVKIDGIRTDWVERDRDQLFAEAVFKVKRGDTWHEMPAELTTEIQESRRAGDEWEAVIVNYLIGLSGVSIQEIAKDALKIEADKLDLNTQRRIGAILTGLKWKQRQVRLSGDRKRLWYSGI